jgi:hypothetical protein
MKCTVPRPPKEEENCDGAGKTLNASPSKARRSRSSCQLFNVVMWSMSTHAPGSTCERTAFQDFDIRLARKRHAIESADNEPSALTGEIYSFDCIGAKEAH